MADLYVSQVSGSNQHRTSTVLVLRVFKGFPENHAASKRSPIPSNSLALVLPQRTSGFGLAGKALPASRQSGLLMPFRPLLPIAHLPLENTPFTVPRFTLYCSASLLLPPGPPPCCVPYSHHSFISLGTHLSKAGSRVFLRRLP